MSFNNDIKNTQQVTFVEKSHRKKHHHHHKTNIHSDHYIEPQHHPSKYATVNRKTTQTTRPTIIKQPENVIDEHPRRIIRKFQPLDRPFPKQEVMLLDIKTDIIRSMSVTFKYNTGDVTKILSEGDVVHAYYVSEKDGDTSLIEILGRISYIDYRNETIYIDYSTTYSHGEQCIFISSLRFISKNIHELPPFIEKEEIDDDEQPYEEIEEEPDYNYDDDNEGIPSNTDNFFIRDDSDTSSTDGIFIIDK